MKKAILILSLFLMVSCNTVNQHDVHSHKSHSGLTVEQTQAVDELMKNFEDRLRAEGAYTEETIQQALEQARESELKKMLPKE